MSAIVLPCAPTSRIGCWHVKELMIFKERLQDLSNSGVMKKVRSGARRRRSPSWASLYTNENKKPLNTASPDTPTCDPLHTTCIKTPKRKQAILRQNMRLSGGITVSGHTQNQPDTQNTAPLTPQTPFPCNAKANVNVLRDGLALRDISNTPVRTVSNFTHCSIQLKSHSAHRAIYNIVHSFWLDEFDNI